MKIAVVAAPDISAPIPSGNLDRGHEICVFDNLSSGFKTESFKEASFVQGDILNPSALDKFFGDFQPEGIVHPPRSKPRANR